MTGHEIRTSGLTLVEVLVSILLLGIVGAAAISLLPPIVQLNQTASYEQEITIAAKGFFEDLQERWSDPALFDADSSASDLPGGAVPPHCSADISQHPSGSYKRVTLSCTDISSPFVLEIGSPV